jgi:hypothetical protein
MRVVKPDPSREALISSSDADDDASQYSPDSVGPPTMRALALINADLSRTSIVAGANITRSVLASDTIVGQPDRGSAVQRDE